MDDLHWLGGVWDGEGCFSLVTQYQKQIAVQSRFTNCSETMIAEVRRILDAHGLTYHVEQRAPTKGKKYVWHLSFNGAKRTQRLLAVLRPYLRAKGLEADLVLRYIALRWNHQRGDPFTSAELDCFFALREIHGYTLSESSETLRSTLAAIGRDDDKVRPSAKSEDPARNDAGDGKGSPG